MESQPPFSEFLWDFQRAGLRGVGTATLSPQPVCLRVLEVESETKGLGRSLQLTSKGNFSKSLQCVRCTFIAQG